MAQRDRLRSEKIYIKIHQGKITDESENLPEANKMTGFKRTDTISGMTFSHGGRIYEAEKNHKRRFIDFSASINPLGIPLNVKNKIFREFDRVLHYPDQRDTINAISDYLGIKDENLLVGNGSSEFIYLLFQALSPKTVIIPEPTFSEYERAAGVNGCRVRFLEMETEKFSLNLSEMDASDMIFLCNPNNPTGNLVIKSYDEIKNLPQKFIVIDETFIDFLPDFSRRTFIRYAVKDKRIIIIRSFTKFFAMPGLRIGYIIADKDIIKLLKNHQIPWSVNSIGLVAAKLMLKNKKYITATLKKIEKERKYLFDEISKTGCFIPYPSVANFLLIKIIKKELTSSIIAESLIKNGLLIRDCSNFRGLDDKFFRVAVLSHKDNVKLISSLKKSYKNE
ncbi:MAG: pyridoxal phosphate-dependent class II aminotransferase [Candidatus Omnitrophica bacterium]|nr:pyridoxal phosphate-dependent class II aminotransferase [Candidatus Omnitrophota bacterium]